MVSSTLSAQLPLHDAVQLVVWPGVMLLSLQCFCDCTNGADTCMCAAEKETPYSLRTQIFLSVQSASLVLDGPDSEQASHDNMTFIS